MQNEELPYFILGNGSNLLVSDEGYRGVIIQLYRNYGDITVKEMKSMQQQELCCHRSRRQPKCVADRI